MNNLRKRQLDHYGHGYDHEFSSKLEKDRFYQGLNVNAEILENK